MRKRLAKKKGFCNWIEVATGKQVQFSPVNIGYKHGRPCYAINFVDGTSGDYYIDFEDREIEKC
jgi:hypothetical protein